MRQGRIRRWSPLLAGVMLILSPAACRTEAPGTDAPALSSSDLPAGDVASDALLLASAKVALPPPGVTPADLPDPASPGAQLLAQYCGQCHALPSPSMHSATDWPRVLRRMWLRMERLPDSLQVRTADEGARNTMLGYLTANALRVSGAELPAGRGRQEFATVCSRCHALPDIRVHSSRDWPAVFLRMERNMERMSVDTPTPDEASRILLYLQDVAAAR